MGPVDNRAHDLGTDLLIQVRDARLFDRGYIIGAQVKSGPSYFEEPAKVHGSEGWWYRESDVKHFDLWVRHTFPHVIVLYNFEANSAYWQLVRAELVQPTDGGAKVFVPTSQTVCEASMSDLMEALLNATPGATKITPLSNLPIGDQLRRSLLAPFSVALPPPGTLAADLRPEEYIAAMLSSRSWMFKGEWRSRRGRQTWLDTFALALRAWIAEDETSSLHRTAANARRRHHRAASFVAVTVIYRDLGEHQAIVELLSPVVDGDILPPVDHAWLCVQRSRALFELGDAERAIADAVAAIRSLEHVASRDFVGDAILRSATWILYQITGPVGDRSVNVSALDDDVRTWRQRLVSESMVRSIDDAHREMTFGGRSVKFGVDVIAANLYFAEMNADLVGDQSSWREVASIRAKSQLLKSRNPDVNLRVLMLDLLVRSGDTEGLRAELNRYYIDGPIECLVRLTERLDSRPIATTEAYGRLVMLRQLGAHYMSEPSAKRALEVLLQVLSRMRATSSNFHATWRVHARAIWQAVEVLLSVTSHRPLHRAFAAEVLAWIERSATNEDLGDAAAALLMNELSPRLLSRLAVRCEERTLPDPIVYGLARADLPAAVAAVRLAAESGDLHAYFALSSDDRLKVSEPGRRLLVADAARRVELTISRARTFMFTQGGYDYARILAQLNLDWPSEAKWPPVSRLLQEALVRPSDKKEVLRYLLARRADFNPSLLRRLRRLTVPETRALEEFEESVDGQVAAFRIGLMRDDEDRVLVGSLAMATGDEGHRASFAELLAVGCAPSLRLILITLIRDPSPVVRRAAALGVGQLAKSERAATFDIVVTAAVRSTGVDTVLWFLRGLEFDPSHKLSRGRRERVHELTVHPSRLVRLAAQRVVDG